MCGANCFVAALLQPLNCSPGRYGHLSDLCFLCSCSSRGASAVPGVRDRPPLSAGREGAGAERRMRGKASAEGGSSCALLIFGCELLEGPAAADVGLTPIITDGGRCVAGEEVTGRSERGSDARIASSSSFDVRQAEAGGTSFLVASLWARHIVI